ncbi:hypothetical protein Hanom_Chr05g00390111 [Helianthus anomalus]
MEFFYALYNLKISNCLAIHDSGLLWVQYLMVQVGYFSSRCHYKKRPLLAATPLAATGQLSPLLVDPRQTQTPAVDHYSDLTVGD